jgi:vitamin B12/bleomycin/antimicrobial peptide transport system ATP-binding/permease protein
MKDFALALRAMLTLALPYFRSEDRWRGRALLAGVIAAEFALVYIAVVTNQWQGRFFNALEARDWSRVQSELFIFGFIVAGNILIGMGMFWVGQHFQMRWRRWTTERFVAQWMANGRHYRVRFADPNVDNIHLRIANDIGVLIQRTYEIGSGFVGVVVMMISFTIILWGISATTPMPLFGLDLSFPGYLVFIALCYAAVGTLIAHRVGRRLITLNFNQQRREADLRYATARVTDHSEEVALLRAEPVERAAIGRRIAALIDNWIRLAWVQSKLTGFIYGYSHISLVVPTLVVAPAYLVGAIPLGVLVQAAAAFQRVESSFSYFVNSYSKIAEWKAALDRVWQMELALQRSDRIELPNAAIAVTGQPSPHLTLHDLELKGAGGEPIAALPDAEFSPGDRLTVSGPSGSGKSTLFRAAMGLWPFGDGAIRVPEGASMLTLPARPYFPLGTLRQALAVPRVADDVADTDIRDALAAVGLGHLSGQLDVEMEWSNVLAAGDQQLVGLARALILKPAVLLIDDADVLTQSGRMQHLLDAVLAKLPDTIVVSATRFEARDSADRRTVILGAVQGVPS